MSRKLIIGLSSLILLMLVVIAAAVYRLYSDVPPADPSLEKAPIQAVTNVSEAPLSGMADKEVHAAEEVKPDKDVPVEQTFTVTNCASGLKNTLRQNADYSLELLDEKGKSQWKIDFKGRVCPPVAEIDYFSNKKIQYLVLSGRSLHLIDRLGREVKNFPFAIPFDGTVGPVAVKNAKGRFWKIETEGGTVYLNYKAGKILTQLPK